MEYMNILNGQVNDFILIFARTSGMIAFAPIFGAKNVPNQVKALLAFSLSIAFTGILGPLQFTPSDNTIGLIMQLIAEASIGSAIGFAATIFFEIVIFAGYIIDYMIGFGFINIVDPQSGSSISIFAFFYNFMALIIFLLVDGHHVLIEIMIRSYELIPVFGVNLNTFSMNYLVTLAGDIYYTGFRIAAPIFIIMFIIDFTLGMISKIVPQLQILVVGFPLKIGVGLSAIGLALKPTAIFFSIILSSYRDTMLWLLKYMGGPP